MKDSPDVQRAITQTIKLHLYTGRHDPRDKRQVPVTSILSKPRSRRVSAPRCCKAQTLSNRNIR